jgi:hypothetical protein
MTRGLASGFPGSRNSEVHIYALSSFRGFASQDFGTGEYKRLSLRYPGCRNTETSNSRHAISFRGFASRDFGTGEYKRLAFRYPGCRNTETPYLIHAIIISGFRKSGFRDWRVQGNLPLGIPGAETPKHQDSNHATLFRGFASWDFGTGEYKETYPWVSRLPKHRNTKTYPCYTYFGVSYKSGFRDCEYKETYPWVSRLPKLRNTKL